MAGRRQQNPAAVEAKDLHCQLDDAIQAMDWKLVVRLAGQLELLAAAGALMEDIQSQDD